MSQLEKDKSKQGKEIVNDNEGDKRLVSEIKQELRDKTMNEHQDPDEASREALKKIVDSL